MCLHSLDCIWFPINYSLSIFEEGMGYLALFWFEFPNVVDSAVLPSQTMASTELGGCGLHFPAGWQGAPSSPLLPLRYMCGPRVNLAHEGTWLLMLRKEARSLQGLPRFQLWDYTQASPCRQETHVFKIYHVAPPWEEKGVLGDFSIWLSVMGGGVYFQRIQQRKGLM